MQRSVARFFAAAVPKKPKMELTIRTPYKTLLEKYTDFKRVITKTNEGVLNIQNRSPPALYVLPPGLLRIKAEKSLPNFSGDVFHTGGFVVVAPDNSCQIHLTEAVERKSLAADRVGKGEYEKTEGGVAAKFIDRIRSNTAKAFNRGPKL